MPLRQLAVVSGEEECFITGHRLTVVVSSIQFLNRKLQCNFTVEIQNIFHMAAACINALNDDSATTSPD